MTTSVGVEVLESLNATTAPTRPTLPTLGPTHRVHPDTPRPVVQVGGRTFRRSTYSGTNQGSGLQSGLRHIPSPPRVPEVPRTGHPKRYSVGGCGDLPTFTSTTPLLGQVGGVSVYSLYWGVPVFRGVTHSVLTTLPNSTRPRTAPQTPLPVPPFHLPPLFPIFFFATLDTFSVVLSTLEDPYCRTKTLQFPLQPRRRTQKNKESTYDFPLQTTWVMHLVSRLRFEIHTPLSSCTHLNTGRVMFLLERVCSERSHAPSVPDFWWTQTEQRHTGVLVSRCRTEIVGFW